MNANNIPSSGSLGFGWIGFSSAGIGPRALGVTEFTDLKSRLLSWMRREAGGFASFDEAAAAVFAWQFERNIPYRRYCEVLGRDPRKTTDWREIPALPTDCFKDARHRPSCFPKERVVRSFQTSGTTRDVKGRHDFADFELYETAILAGWREMGLPEIRNPWFLSLSPDMTPHSSLAHMFGTLGNGVKDRWMMDETGKVDLAGLAAQRSPVHFFSTAIGLLRLMESHPRIPLPEGSWIFETGGYKGLSVSLDPDVFRRRVGECFGIPVSRILNEYSMTELSSQFYRWPDEPAHRGPFWTRIRVVDPETGREADAGQTGYLEIVDPANLGSVAAIRTQDLAIARGDSEFELLGRDPGALPRGCSRAADNLITMR